MRGTNWSRIERRRSCCSSIDGSNGGSLGVTGILKMLSEMPCVGCVFGCGICGAAIGVWNVTCCFVALLLCWYWSWMVSYLFSLLLLLLLRWWWCWSLKLMLLLHKWCFWCAHGVSMVCLLRPHIWWSCYYFSLYAVLLNWLRCGEVSPFDAWN